MADALPGVTDISDSDEPSGPTGPAGIRWFAVVLLLAYIALLAIGAISLWRMGGGGLASWIAASVFALLFILGWRLWLKPGSNRRLAFRERTTVHLVGGPIVIILASLAQVWLPAIVALSIIVMCDALNERDRRPDLSPFHPPI